MAIKADSIRPLTPRELIFSCNICHESIRDIPTPAQDEKGLAGARKPVAKLWMTECAHLTCAKHFEDGAPPFHPAGKPPRVVCPVCVERQNNHAQRQIFPINGFAKDEHDSDIPDRFFMCPPIELDGKDNGQDAMRFQFLCLVYHGISITAEYRNLQVAFSRLREEVEKTNSEKIEAEAEVQALNERVELLEAASRKYRGREPEIEHYLRQFTAMKAELDRRYEDLNSMGFHCPRIDFSFHPAGLLDDEGTHDGRNTSYAEQTYTEVDRRGANVVEERPMESISSTTLRGDSSRTPGVNDAQTSPKKRQKVSEFKHIPKVLKKLPEAVSAATPTGLMPPPKYPASRSPSKKQQADGYLPDRTNDRHPDESAAQINGYNPVHLVRQSNAQAYNESTPRHIRSQFEEAPYMSGALQSQKRSPTRCRPSPVHRVSRQIIQPVDDISSFSTPNMAHQEDMLNRRIHATHSGNTAHSQGPIHLPTRGVSGTHDPRSYEASVPYTKQDRCLEFHSGPRSHNVPYRSPVKQTPTRPVTPSPQHLKRVQQPSVSSPFFRGQQNGEQNVSSMYRVTPSTQSAQPTFARPHARKQRRERPPGAAPEQTINGLSFVDEPYLSFDDAYIHDVETQELVGTSQAPRDSNGYFVRQDMASTPRAAASPRYGMQQPRHYDNRPQPLPSATPSLASSINMTQKRRQPLRDRELASFRGVKDASASSRGYSSGMFGSSSGLFSGGGGRRSVRR